MIGVIYVPPQSSRYYNADDFVALEEETTSVCSKYDYVYLTDDLNAQTANMKDYNCLDRSFDKFLDLDQDTISFLDEKSFQVQNKIQVDRFSMDKKKNNTGYSVIDFCKNNNCFLLNGRYGDDKGAGKYTFREQSVIGYSISSEKGFKLLKNFEIFELDRRFSDGHSLLIMTLKFTPQIDMTIQNLSNDSITKKQDKCAKMI